MITNLILVIWRNYQINTVNTTYHHSINKKPINVNFSTLTKNIETNSRALRFKFNVRVRIT